jgi:hypothetical protein
MEEEEEWRGELNWGTLYAYMEMSHETPIQLLYTNKDILKNLLDYQLKQLTNP